MIGIVYQIILLCLVAYGVAMASSIFYLFVNGQMLSNNSWDLVFDDFVSNMTFFFPIYCKPGIVILVIGNLYPPAFGILIMLYDIIWLSS